MLAEAMNESRSMPTATSFRTLAVDTLDAKRKALNAELKERGMKVSFTHLIAWAIVRATVDWPAMARSYEERDGKPTVIDPGHVNLGIAVDVERKDGSRSLMVPCIKAAETVDFAAFHASLRGADHEDAGEQAHRRRFQGHHRDAHQSRRPRHGRLGAPPDAWPGDDRRLRFARLPGRAGTRPPREVKALGVSKVMTTSSTYDHRIIQGAESGSFLRRIDQLLQGEDAPTSRLPRRWGSRQRGHDRRPPRPRRCRCRPPHPRRVAAAEPDRELLQAVQAATSLLKAYRTHGHLAARVNPLGGEPKGDPALEPENLNLTPETDDPDPGLDLADRSRGRNAARRAAADAPGLPRPDRLSDRASVLAPATDVAAGDDRDGWHRAPLSDEERRALLSRLIQVYQFERFLQKAYLGQKAFSIEGLDVIVPMIDEIATLGAGTAPRRS